MSDETDPREYFIETMGLVSQADGGPRIAGRIVGLLIIEERLFTLNQMAERLKVSKASISTNARLLLRSGLLQMSTRPGDRQDYYEIGPDPFRRILESVTDRMRRAADQIETAEHRFTDADPAGRERVRELQRFYARSSEFLTQWAEHIGEERLVSQGAYEDERDLK